MGAALEPPEIALAGVPKLRRAVTLFASSKHPAAVMPPRTLAARSTIALARLGATSHFFAQIDTGKSPSSEGQHKCERSEALVGGDSRRTARATTADYLLWRARGAALSFATGRRAILWGDHLFFAQLDTGTSPSSKGQHKCERSEARVGGDSRRTARATTADYLLWRAKGAALSFATGRRAIPWGRPALSLG